MPKIDLIQKGAMLDPFSFTVTTEKLGEKRDCMAGVQKAGWKSIYWWIATVCYLSGWDAPIAEFGPGVGLLVAELASSFQLRRDKMPQLSMWKSEGKKDHRSTSVSSCCRPVSTSGCSETGAHGLPLIISASMLTMDARSLIIKVFVFT